jgi:hypothetical protein
MAMDLNTSVGYLKNADLISKEKNASNYMNRSGLSIEYIEMYNNSSFAIQTLLL